MLCQVYRSQKKQGAYLYLAQGKTLKDIPEELSALLGQCIQVLQLNLAKREKLATENIDMVKANLTAQGYHLQMPPKSSVQVINYK